MDKTYRTEFRRKFLIEALPEPLTRASGHIQIFDNYIAGTRMRLRSVRDPETKAWSWIVQQRLPMNGTDISAMKIGEIQLNEVEHAVFAVFEGTEIRKNRYFHEFDRLPFAFDIYLGGLWGLNIANVDFPDKGSMDGYEPPPFAIFEVSHDPFFLGENLVEKKFEDVQNEVAAIGSSSVVGSEVPDE